LYFQKYIDKSLKRCYNKKVARRNIKERRQKNNDYQIAEQKKQNLSDDRSYAFLEENLKVDICTHPRRVRFLYSEFDTRSGVFCFAPAQNKDLYVALHNKIKSNPW
jgi:hypothetical protein